LEFFDLPAAKVRIAQYGERSVLIVERFDCLWTEHERLLRIPQEDCCQALSVPPTLKDESDGGSGIASIFRIPVKGREVCVLTDHIKSMDWRVQRAEFYDKAPEAVWDQTRELLSVLSSMRLRTFSEALRGGHV
jgi:hypothetical protein